MLNKLFRINKSKEYQDLYKKSLKFPGKYLIMYISTNSLSRNRFGIVASKKVGNAVKRNKSRRRLRAIVEENRERLKPGHNIIIIARKSIVKADYKMIGKDFYTVMKKAGLC